MILIEKVQNWLKILFLTLALVCFMALLFNTCAFYLVFPLVKIFMYWPNKHTTIIQHCLSFFLFFFFFPFLAAPQHVEFPGQGSDPTHSRDLSHTCCNTRSLSHCAGIEPASQLPQDAGQSWCAISGTLVLPFFQFSTLNGIYFSTSLHDHAVFCCLIGDHD